jgi:cytosine/adenosine deaminase-related metal-dependent hydrolase
MTPARPTIHEASWVCPATSEPIRDGAIAVGDGRILQVGSQSDLRALAGPRVQHPGAAIIPGFVNTHTHIELTVFRGFI